MENSTVIAVSTGADQSRSSQRSEASDRSCEAYTDQGYRSSCADSLSVPVHLHSGLGSYKQHQVVR